MQTDEMRHILATCLARYRSWNYSRLAERVKSRDSVLEWTEGTAADGTEYQIEIQVAWDGKPGGDIRVFGDLSAEPQKRLIPFLPIYVSDINDDFIMTRDGRFVGEDDSHPNT